MEKIKTVTSNNSIINPWPQIGQNQSMTENVWLIEGGTLIYSSFLEKKHILPKKMIISKAIIL